MNGVCSHIECMQFRKNTIKLDSLNYCKCQSPTFRGHNLTMKPVCHKCMA